MSTPSFARRLRAATVVGVLLGIATLIATACGDATPTGVKYPAGCEPSSSLDPKLVPKCMRDLERINDATLRDADSVLSAAERFLDSLGLTPATTDAQTRRSEMLRSMFHLSDFYHRGFFEDSTRFDRMVDQVAVTLEYLRGLLPVSPLKYRPKRTPGLTWVYYSNLGIYQQPVTSVEAFAFNFPAPSQNPDSLKALGEALYNYSVWQTTPSGVRYPVWEYYFPWNTGGWNIQEPWHSAMAQGLVLFLYTLNYVHTNDPKWKTRAFEVFESYKVTIDNGGVMTPDTTHGYWWDEYVPTVQVWNGSVTALLELDYFAKIFDVAEAKRMVASGVNAVRYFTPFYDTGIWCLYSKVQGNVSKAYMTYHIQLADTLFGRTGDPFFKTVAERWRGYRAPAGVADFMPFDSPNMIISPASAR